MPLWVTRTTCARPHCNGQLQNVHRGKASMLNVIKQNKRELIASCLLESSPPWSPCSPKCPSPHCLSKQAARLKCCRSVKVAVFGHTPLCLWYASYLCPHFFPFVFSSPVCTRSLGCVWSSLVNRKPLGTEGDVEIESEREREGLRQPLFSLRWTWNVNDVATAFTTAIINDVYPPCLWAGSNLAILTLWCDPVTSTFPALSLWAVFGQSASRLSFVLGWPSLRRAAVGREDTANAEMLGGQHRNAANCANSNVMIVQRLSPGFVKWGM